MRSPPAGTASGRRVDSATKAFVAHRNLLFTVAYEMLGSAITGLYGVRNPEKLSRVERETVVSR